MKAALMRVLRSKVDLRFDILVLLTLKDHNWYRCGPNLKNIETQRNLHQNRKQVEFLIRLLFFTKLSKAF